MRPRRRHHDSNNKLTQLVHSQAGTTTFGYDDNGNMTGMDTPGTDWTYGYDYENRLTGVSSTAGYTAAYTYNADGLRLRAQESNHAYPDRWFQYDGVRPVLEGTLSGDTFTAVNRYSWEGDSYYDPLISASIGGWNRYYMYDGLGSTRQLLNADQTTTDTYTYEAFGNLLGSTGSTVNPYRYVGSLGYYQTGSSLMHLGARYYMPEVGRFVQRDPLRMLEYSSPATGFSQHPYAYCSNMPAGAVDPAGLQGQDTNPMWGDILGLAACLVKCAIPYGTVTGIGGYVTYVACGACLGPEPTKITCVVCVAGMLAAGVGIYEFKCCVNKCIRDHPVHLPSYEGW